MDSSPRVSVIIPTFNRSGLLIERSLKSILNQTLKDWECIVVDDGSTDDTEEVMKKVCATDERIKYLKIKNSGQATARNRGIDIAKGKYIAFNDDDDEYLPSFLECMTDFLDGTDTSIGFASSSFYLKDDEGNLSLVTPPIDPPWSSSVGNGWILRRECFSEKGIRFDETNQIEDIDLHIRLDEAGYKGFVLEEPLRVYHLAFARNASHSSNYGKVAKEFDVFFEKNEETYKRYGENAHAWICLFGSVFHLRAGNTKKGIYLLLESIMTRPSVKAVLYLCFALFGKTFFNFFFIIRERGMRFLRVHFLNKLTKSSLYNT